MSDTQQPGPLPLAGAKKGDWIITEEGRCHELLSDLNPQSKAFSLSNSRHLLAEATLEGRYSFGGHKSGTCRLATPEELAAWREREEAKRIEAEAERLKWDEDERKRDAANAMYDALKALMGFWDNGTPVHSGAEVVADARAAIAKADGK